MPVRPPAGPEAHARGGPEVISEIFLNKYESTFVLSKVLSKVVVLSKVHVQYARDKLLQLINHVYV